VRSVARRGATDPPAAPIFSDPGDPGDLGRSRPI